MVELIGQQASYTQRLTHTRNKTWPYVYINECSNANLTVSAPPTGSLHIDRRTSGQTETETEKQGSHITHI